MIYLKKFLVREKRTKFDNCVLNKRFDGKHLGFPVLLRLKSNTLERIRIHDADHWTGTTPV